MTRFAGTGTLLALALRRDRVMVPAWILTFSGVIAFVAEASRGLYSSTAELVRVSDGWNATTAVVAIHGRIYDPASLGSATLGKPMGLGTAMVGLLAVLLVVRHTRADEEVGRTELAAGGVVGTYAALTAALVVSVGTVLALSVLSGLALAAFGLPLAGSLAFAAAWTGTGLVFASVGACAAQVAVTARAARGLGSAVLGAFYVVRAVGDTAPEHGARWVSWLSPVGWAQQVRPYAGDRWWALLPVLALTGALVGVAYALLARRDLGEGMLAERPGPGSAPRLTSAPALAWRLQRFALLGWAVGVVVAAALVGSIASTITDLLDSPEFRRYIELLGGLKILEDAFLSAEIGIVAVVVSAYGISAAMRMHGEESQGRAEPVLATGVSRTEFAGAHLLVALGGTLALMAAAGLSMGVSYALTVGDADQVPRVLGAALVRLPAVWLMTATVMALYGLSSRLTVVAWVLLVAVVVVGEFGPLMDLPGWTLDVSPFTHVPSLPGGSFDLAPLAWMTAIAAALLAGGLVGFRRRDLRSD